MRKSTLILLGVGLLTTLEWSAEISAQANKGKLPGTVRTQPPPPVPAPFPDNPLGGTTLPSLPSLSPVPDSSGDLRPSGPSPPRGKGRATAPPAADYDHEDDYLEDLEVSNFIYQHAARLLIVQFHPTRAVREAALRREIERIYIELANQAFRMAAKAVIENERQALAAISKEFRWTTPEEMARKRAAIDAHERELRRLRQRALTEAQQLTRSWKPPTQARDRGRVEFGTGPAFSQLQTIGNSGWSGF